MVMNCISDVELGNIYSSTIAKKCFLLDSFDNRRPNVMARRMLGIQRFGKKVSPFWRAGISYQPDWRAFASRFSQHKLLLYFLSQPFYPVDADHFTAAFYRRPSSITTTLPQLGQFLARNRFAEGKATKLSSAWTGRHGEVLEVHFLRTVVVILGGASRGAGPCRWLRRHRCHGRRYRSGRRSRSSWLKGSIPATPSCRWRLVRM